MCKLKNIYIYIYVYTSRIHNSNCQLTNCSVGEFASGIRAMNKVGKHIQSGIGGAPNAALSTAALLGTPLEATNGAGSTSTTNVFNSIMSFLPDNRPITSLHIVEDFERLVCSGPFDSDLSILIAFVRFSCPKNFSAISRTYDQDSDADLWRDYSLFGRQNTRYLCLSKSEGLPEYVVETLQ